jgi:DNA-directed RNA polymerase specialized sigma24 family protein
MLQKALDTLESRYKEPFLMVFLEGLSCREAAEELDIPLGTILSRIHRARSFLRGAIKRQEADSPGSEVREKVETGNIRYHPRFGGGEKK